MNNFIINRISKSKFDRYNDDLYDDDKYFKDIPYDHKIIVRLNYLQPIKQTENRNKFLLNKF